MNAITFILNEHNKIRHAFFDISDSSHRDSTKHKRFQSLCEYLIRHETMEQTVWYPYLRKNAKLAEVIKHLVTEEKTAAKKIKEFDRVKTQEEWEAKFKALKKDVLHHAEEEETKLFPKVEQLIDERDLDIIGKELREFKAEYQEA